MSTLASKLTPLELLGGLTKTYASARATLSERVNALEDEVRDVHRRKVPGIKAALAAAKDAQAALVAAVQAHPELFVKPRTITINGIKAGYQQGKGTLDWDDDDKLVARIEKLFPDQRDVLIATKKKPVADALKQLDAKDLARLGVSYEAVGDYVVVKATDGEVDKLVKKILKEGAVEESETN
jgi:hypothetical protein